MAYQNGTIYVDALCIAYKTAQLWKNSNPILKAGAIAVESDTLRIKIGNGSTPWNSLPYIDNDVRSLVSTQSTVNENQAAKITALETKTSGHDTKISNLESTVSGHTTTINGHTSTINTHTTDINGLKSTTGTHTTDITGLKNRVSALETQLANYEKLSTAMMAYLNSWTKKLEKEEGI